MKQSTLYRQDSQRAITGILSEIQDQASLHKNVSRTGMSSMIEPCVQRIHPLLRAMLTLRDELIL